MIAALPGAGIVALAALAMLASAPGAALAVTVEARTATSADDAEEFASGKVYINSSDLELVFDTSVQTVGMRWAALAIPPGATITAAYIQFAAKEAHSEATTLTLRGQAADNPIAFTTVAGNVSTRPRSTAAATWTPAAWLAGEIGANQRTSDLSAVIQEIVNRPGWLSGNALAIIVAGTGHRTAYAYDGRAASAPLLHVEYTTGPVFEAPPVARLTVSQVASPALTVLADGSTSTDGDATPIAIYRFDFGDGTAAVTTSAPTATAQHTYATSGDYTVTLIATDTGGNPSAPVIATVAVTAASPPPPPTGATVEKRTLASADDAEESASGSMYLTSSDLELVFDTSVQTIGMRWTALAIPPGATITAAYIQFAAKSAHTEATSLTLRGQAADNPLAFTTGAGNVSTRPRTTAATTWTPAAWLAGEAGANQRTTDLSGVIQEIVSRPGWASGNALAIIISGSGRRAAYSYDGRAASAPLLHVEYTTGPVSEAPPVARLTVSQLASPALTVLADGSTSTDADATPIASYRFTFGDGAAAVTTTAPTATAQHTYAASGNYTVTLIATDTGGSASAPVTANVNVIPPGGTQVAVYTGYYDTHHPGNTQPKPSPWIGSPNTVFVGQPDSPGSSTLDWDTSALRVENLTGGSLSGVVVTADIGSKRFDLWGANTIPAGWNLVLAQTFFEAFDGSDLNAAGCYDCNPNDCLTKVSSVIPVVRVTIGGTTTVYYDTGQQLNTNGVDAAGCPYTGERNDESQAWERVYTQLPAGYVVQRDAAGEVTLVTSPALELWMAAPYPNPSHGRLVFSFRTGGTGEVRLGVYDITGRLVRQSVNSILGAGDYRNAMDLSGLASGAYFCRLTTPEGSRHKTFMLVH